MINLLVKVIIVSVAATSASLLSQCAGSSLCHIYKHLKLYNNCKVRIYQIILLLRILKRHSTSTLKIHLCFDKTAKKLKKSTMKFILLFALFALCKALIDSNDTVKVTTTGSTCGGNCPSGSCTSCPCGSTPSYQNIAEWCAQATNGWNQVCHYLRQRFAKVFFLTNLWIVNVTLSIHTIGKLPMHHECRICCQRQCDAYELRWKH